VYSYCPGKVDARRMLADQKRRPVTREGWKATACQRLSEEARLVQISGLVLGGKADVGR
jgi:hypothetical protein